MKHQEIFWVISNNPWNDLLQNDCKRTTRKSDHTHLQSHFKMENPNFNPSIDQQKSENELPGMFQKMWRSFFTKNDVLWVSWRMWMPNHKNILNFFPDRKLLQFCKKWTTMAVWTSNDVRTMQKFTVKCAAVLLGMPMCGHLAQQWPQPQLLM